MVNGRSRAACAMRFGAALGAGALLVATAGGTPALADLPTRAYEMVSPPDKGGYPVVWSENGSNIGQAKLSRDGDTAIYASWGAFADVQGGMPPTYRATREAGGWRTRVASPRTVTPIPDAALQYGNAWTIATPDLRFGLLGTRDDLDPDVPENTYQLYTSTDDGRPSLVSRAEDGRPAGAGTSLNLVSLSADGRHAYFTADTSLVAADAGRTVGADLYESVDGRTTLLNQESGVLLNRCGSNLGGYSFVRPAVITRNAVTHDGSQVVFSVPGGSFDFSKPDCLRPTRIFRRFQGNLDEVSASEATVPDAPAYASYQGASVDGSRVIFTSDERLLDGVPSGGLYAYDTEAPIGRRLSLLVASNDVSVVKTSDDARAIYLTSGNPLAPGGSGVPALYLYRDGSAGSTLRWVADDLAFDFSNLTGDESNRAVRISADGTVLSFVTRAPLTGFDNVDPRTAAATAQVFVYDDRVGLRCASCDPAGQRPSDAPVTGDASVGTQVATDQNPHGTSDDGSRVFFNSPDRLVAGDRNSRRDVYEYSDGRLQLISSGRGRSDAALADVSSSGDTVLFSTAESLVPQDVDGGDLDMYVARVGGGFPAPPIEPPPGAGCDGDPCQGPPSNPPADEAPGSSALSEDPPSPPPPARPTARLLATSSATLRSLARTGRARIAVRTSGPGAVAVTLRARVGGRLRTVARGSVRARRGSTVRVTVRLSAAARRALARQRTLPVRLSARFAGKPIGSTVKLVLRSAASPARGGRR